MLNQPKIPPFFASLVRLLLAGALGYAGAKVGGDSATFVDMAIAPLWLLLSVFWSKVENKAITGNSLSAASAVGAAFASIFRAAVMYCFARFGFDKIEGHSEAAAWITGAAWTCFSLAWSYIENHRIKSGKPPFPPVAGPPVILVVLVSATLASSPSCVRPEQARPVIGYQHEAILLMRDRLAKAGALLEQQVASAIAARRVLLAGEIHRSFISAGYIEELPPNSVPVVSKFQADVVADPPVENALVAEVRAGRLTVVTAGHWLADYVLATNMVDADAAKDRQISKLLVVEDFDRVSALALDAVRQSNAENARLSAEALDLNDSLRQFAEARYYGFEIADTASASILSKVPEKDRRPVANLLDSVIGKKVPK